MNNLPVEFKALYKAADAIIQKEANVQQAIAVRASGNIIYAFADHDICSGNVKEELQFESLLRRNNSAEITELVCLWDSGALDIPSRYLRSALLKMNPNNIKTKILLAGAMGYIVKELGEI